MNHRRALTALVLTSLLTGCVSPTIPPDAQTTWTPPHDAQQPDTDWQALRARQVDTSHPLTLSELFDIALQHTPATRVAWNAARVAAANVQQAQGYLMPTVTAVAGAERQEVSAEPEGFDQSSLRYGPGLKVDYLVLSFGGGRKAAVESALQTVYATDYTFNQSIQNVLLATASAYYGVVSAESAIAAADMSVTNATTVLEAATQRRTAGTGTELEVLQARTLLNQSLFVRADAEGTCQSARALLAQVAGLPAGTNLKVAGTTAAVPQALMPPDLQPLIDDAIQRRPDIAALRATLAARKAYVRVAGAPLWPALYLNGSVNRDYYHNYGPKDLQDDDWSYGAGLNVTWDLFDGRQTLGAKRAARAEADAAQAQLERAELAASAEVWTRFHAYATALEKHTFSVAALDSASAAYDLALSSYKAGLSSLLDLLSAENQQAQARFQQVAAREDVFTALAGLAHATGTLAQDTAVDDDPFAPPTRKDTQP
ncbi:MAG: TolC family protein [Lentisphaerae bacterium]|nr:TolC family protein [Lentisphaerota bacterium]